MLQPVTTTQTAILSPHRIIAALGLTTRLTWRDRLQNAAIRCGVGRNRAVFPPGLYFVGKPDNTSPVLVTANYILTVNMVRRELNGVHAWLLIVDTGGVNVWCAAGKGRMNASVVAKALSTFRVADVSPEGILVLPQLSASGIDGNELGRLTGRRVVFGPVYARDIPRFLSSGMVKDASMRDIHFTAPERAVLVPVEFAHSGIAHLAALLLALPVSLPADGQFPGRFIALIIYNEASLLVSLILFPLALPFLPGKYFSVKGMVLHILWTVCVLLVAGKPAGLGYLSLISSIAIFGAVSSYIAMNFTGSTTYTNQNGVIQEVKRSLPFLALTLATGIATTIIHLVRVLNR